MKKLFNGLTINELVPTYDYRLPIDIFNLGSSNGESTELAVEIDRFKRLVRSSETTFDRNATELDVFQWLAKSYLLDLTPA